MILQSYFNVISKVGLIFSYYIRIFLLSQKQNEIEKSYFNRTLLKFEGKNIIFNEVFPRFRFLEDEAEFSVFSLFL